jgi:triacylglycerol lipase
MAYLEWRLESAGYQVVNESYPSVTRPIETLAAEAVPRGIDACREAGASPVNFVTHSLGSILVRYYLAHSHVDDLGRVVMLGPPNQGSQMADFYLEQDGLSWLRPPALEQLGTGANSIPRLLGPVNFPVGVIAGEATSMTSVAPGSPDAPGDGTVTVAEAQVEGMADMIVMPVGHTFMMWDADVADEVLFFLEQGRFNHAAVPPLH